MAAFLLQLAVNDAAAVSDRLRLVAARETRLVRAGRRIPHRLGRGLFRASGLTVTKPRIRR
jgi:hypothetical protein